MLLQTVWKLSEITEIVPFFTIILYLFLYFLADVANNSVPNFYITKQFTFSKKEKNLLHRF